MPPANPQEIILKELKNVQKKKQRLESKVRELQKKIRKVEKDKSSLNLRIDKLVKENIMLKEKIDGPVGKFITYLIYKKLYYNMKLIV